jgi:hypothetical protein
MTLNKHIVDLSQPKDRQIAERAATAQEQSAADIKSAERLAIEQAKEAQETRRAAALYNLRAIGEDGIRYETDPAALAGILADIFVLLDAGGG